MEHLEILEKYFSKENEITIQTIDNGLINSTFLVEDKNENKKFILQKINSQIFKNPKVIIENQVKIATLLQQNNYPKIIIELIKNKDRDYLSLDSKNNAWRLTNFVENSTTLLKVPNPETAEKTAKAFSEFYLFLNKYFVELEEVLPGFLDFEKRIVNFENSLVNTTSELKNKAEKAIIFLVKNKNLPNNWINWQKNKNLPTRIIHADPKISNILLDNFQNPICIIDWDTIMPATLLYDFGDMIRSYTNKTDEDNATTKDNFDFEIYQSVKKGFLYSLDNFLENIEKENLDYAAQVVIYIQAIRFLTDYLNGSVYYSTKYEDHNLDRTMNQINLLKGLQNYLA